jgi:hypothetical protein
MRCQNSTLLPNGMDALIASEGNVTTSHRLGRKLDAARSIGMEYRNPSLRTNGMSELLTAPERNGTILNASEGSAAAPFQPRGEMGCPSEHRSQMSEPLTASQ